MLGRSGLVAAARTDGARQGMPFRGRELCRRWATAFMLAIAASCASTPSIPSPDALDATLNARFAGRPFGEATARYGMPSYRFDADRGVTVFVWETTTTMRFHEPVTTTTTGTIGDSGARPWMPAVPYRQTTTTRQGYNVDMACLMQIGVKPNGIIERVGFSGKMGACQAFMP